MPDTSYRSSASDSILRWCKGFATQWQLQSMAILGVVYMLIFNFVPIYGLTIAFKNYSVVSGIGGSEWIGLENFKIILQDKYFWESVVNTFGISAIKLSVGFVLPIIIAILIFELKWTPFKKLVQTITYLPHFLSWIILGGMLITWMSTNGMMNDILAMIGLKSKTNHMLDANKYWVIAALSDVWKEAGWGTILYLATMSKIDPTYYEAAEIDGASRIRKIWSITLPSLGNILALNLILSVAGLFNSNLDQTLVLMNSQNQPKAEVINSYVYRVGLSQGDFAYATAVGLGVSVISVILLVGANVVTKKLNDNRSVL